MTTRACSHWNRRTPFPGRDRLRGLAAEPFRVFFCTGALWSVVGVTLWPMFYAQMLGFFPNVIHARIMIEAFGGAFVVGFLGTAGPRLAGAPPLTLAELLWLSALHLSCGACHVLQRIAWGDLCFIALLASLVVSLGIRAARFVREPLPPQLLLAWAGLGCGIAGAALQLGEPTDVARFRLAGLLLYQGFLLLPVLGIGSYFFPRMLGGQFGEPESASRGRAKLIRAAAAAILLVGSFFLEAGGYHAWGGIVRVLVATGYLVAELRRVPVPSGTLAVGWFWALGLGWLGLALVPFHELQRVSVAHLLYIGGFGLLMVIVGSRVLFGHSGDLDGFHVKSHLARVLVFLGVLTAATRATPAWAPTTTVSHHIYAACTWGALAVLWLLWHRHRFTTREKIESGDPCE